MIALITGATSGFGHACALRLAQLGYHIIITGRRAERLTQLQTTISETYKVQVKTLCFDIQDKVACETAWKSLPENWQQIDILINNAGLAATASPIDEANMDDFERMIDTNIKGLLYISQWVIASMRQHQSGQIINISSIAGVEVYPNGSVYCATKHAVNAITKAMRIDLLKYNIKVSSISPGAAETEFSLVRYKGDTEKAKAVYLGIEPLMANDIADTMEFIVTRPAHVAIHDILIMPTQQATASLFNRKA